LASLFITTISIYYSTGEDVSIVLRSALIATFIPYNGLMAKILIGSKFRFLYILVGGNY
jgi:hypothetical protein